ncbi:MAG: hypothetical protein J0L92_24075 [Deltaproteobacteria bacterium]|nr:hypothetical protein [Deltaproteobacteria bacterium]
MSDASEADTTSDAEGDETKAVEATPEQETKADVVASASTDRVISLIGGDDETTWVRRKMVVFRRLEPDDVRTAGSFVVEESPYLEARLVELRIPKKTHREMVALAKKRRDTLSIASGLMRSYEPAGWLLAGAGGGLVGVWLDYLPFAFLWPLVGVLIAGVGVGVATRFGRTNAEAEADRRWGASPDKKDHDALARELAESWAAAQASLKRESGFHTVIRVAEGSVDPLRLASIDPRPYAADPPLFDPDDFLPSEESGAVRYELVHATGEVVTRALEGTSDFAES